MKSGLEINPEITTILVLLSRQNIGNKMVPTKEPIMPENILDIKYRGTIILLNI